MTYRAKYLQWTTYLAKVFAMDDLLGQVIAMDDLRSKVFAMDDFPTPCCPNITNLGRGRFPKNSLYLVPVIVELSDLQYYTMFRNPVPAPTAMKAKMLHNELISYTVVP
jgi:hypothetical protein